MSGRFIGKNIRLLYDIMMYTDINDIPGLLILIDFEQALTLYPMNLVCRCWISLTLVLQSSLG